jgi:hypothetical protein
MPSKQAVHSTHSLVSWCPGLSAGQTAQWGSVSLGFMPGTSGGAEHGTKPFILFVNDFSTAFQR